MLLHSTVADRRMWEPMVPGLVAAGFRTIWYDLRGFGESPTDDVDFSYGADLVAVLDELGARRAAVVGSSRGGSIALDAALEFPDRVAAVVHVGAFISGLERGRTAAEQQLFDAMEAAHEAGDPAAEAEIDAQLWLDGPTAPGRISGEERAVFIALDLPNCMPGRVVGRALALQPPAADRLGELRVPVLAIVGSLDLSAALAAAERLESQVPGARRVILTDVGHMAPLEAPDLVGELIIEHLRGVPAWR